MSIRVYSCVEFRDPKTSTRNIIKPCLFGLTRDDSCLFVFSFFFILKKKHTTRVYFVSVIRRFVCIRVYLLAVSKICPWHNNKTSGFRTKL